MTAGRPRGPGSVAGASQRGVADTGREAPTRPYGETFAQWRDSAGPDWARYVDHPFVKGLGEGTLPREAFLYYLRQDYLFLIHFARAWALAVTKADSLDAMRQCAGTVAALIGDEIRLHIETCAAEGLSEADLAATPEDPANIAYTRYVLDAGHTGDFVDLLAALAPCVIGYAEIGARLASTAKSDAFAGWIATYSGDDYQGLARDVGALIDGAVARRLGPAPADGPRWPELCDRFHTATRLEVRFWQMGLDAV